MSDLISRQAALDMIDAELNGWLTDDERLHLEGLATGIECLPTIDAVPVGAYEQTRWERDTAIEQLAEIGKSLCEKMDNVATVVRCKECKWWGLSSHNTLGIHICKKYNGVRFDSDYCSRAERSEDGET